MIKYRLYAPNDGDTMTVDGGGGWDSPANDDRKGVMTGTMIKVALPLILVKTQKSKLS